MANKTHSKGNNKMEELRCKDCERWYKVEPEVYDRYFHEGDDYQCEECFYNARDKFFDNTIKAI